MTKNQLAQIIFKPSLINSYCHPNQKLWSGGIAFSLISGAKHRISSFVKIDKNQNPQFFSDFVQTQNAPQSTTLLMILLMDNGHGQDKLKIDLR